jgi:putative permease
MREVVRYAVVILATLGVIIALWEFREAVVLFLLSLVVGAAFRPLVERLLKLGWPRLVAVLLPYFIFLALLIGLIAVLGRPVGRELQHATDNVALSYERLQRSWAEGSSFQQAVAGQLPPLESLYAALAGEQGQALAQGAAGVASNVFGLISSIAIVLALSMYWSIDRVYFERLWLSLLPAGQRARARGIWREIEHGVGSYIRSEVVQALLAGLLLGVLYSLIGLRYPTLLALVGAFAWLIPWLGGVLALIPAFILGLEGGLALALMAGAVTLGVIVLMEVIVERRFFERRRYSSVLLVLVAIAMADVMGLLGVIISPPLAAAIQILGRRLLLRPSASEVSDPRLRINALRERLEKVRAHAVLIDPPPVHVQDLLRRLERTITKAEGELAELGDGWAGLPAGTPVEPTRRRGKRG